MLLMLLNKMENLEFYLLNPNPPKKENGSELLKKQVTVTYFTQLIWNKLQINYKNWDMKKQQEVLNVMPIP
jgi:hypothetical protein